MIRSNTVIETVEHSIRDYGTYKSAGFSELFTVAKIYTDFRLWKPIYDGIPWVEAVRDYIAKNTSKIFYI